MTITMTVRAKNGAVVYDINDTRIPDTYTPVPISPGVVMALKAGDLEEAQEKDLPSRVAEDIARRHDEAEKPAHERGRKHRGQSSDSGFGL